MKRWIGLLGILALLAGCGNTTEMAQMSALEKDERFADY